MFPRRPSNSVEQPFDAPRVRLVLLSFALGGDNGVFDFFPMLNHQWCTGDRFADRSENVQKLGHINPNASFEAAFNILRITITHHNGGGSATIVDAHSWLCHDHPFRKAKPQVCNKVRPVGLKHCSKVGSFLG